MALKFCCLIRGFDSFYQRTSEEKIRTEVKDDLKLQTDFLFSIITQEYEKNKAKLSKDELIKHIKSIVSSVRYAEDGYFWIIGRVDDVIKVSGYRLGTAEIESALVSHLSVAEAAAIGLPHEIKGNAIYTYVILKSGYKASDELKEELRKHVGHEVGPIAKPEQITFVDSLPKTRSGKIMRRVLKAKELGLDPGNLSTLEE